jgi:hypothetical protein
MNLSNFTQIYCLTFETSLELAWVRRSLSDLFNCSILLNYLLEAVSDKNEMQHTVDGLPFLFLTLSSAASDTPCAQFPVIDFGCAITKFTSDCSFSFHSVWFTCNVREISNEENGPIICDWVRVIKITSPPLEIRMHGQSMESRNVH